jgi:S1-C subfamily serine protease
VKTLLAVTHLGCIGIVLLSGVGALTAEAPALPDVIDKIKPAIVALGAFQKTRRPPSIFRGTGFVIADGLHVVTNAHVVPEKLDTEKKEVVAVFVGKANLVEVREATKVVEDRDHDLAVLRITGRPITAMTLGDANRVREERSMRLPGSRSAGSRIKRRHTPRNYFRDNPGSHATAHRATLGKENY